MGGNRRREITSYTDNQQEEEDAFEWFPPLPSNIVEGKKEEKKKKMRDNVTYLSRAYTARHYITFFSKWNCSTTYFFFSFFFLRIIYKCPVVATVWYRGDCIHRGMSVATTTKKKREAPLHTTSTITKGDEAEKKKTSPCPGEERKEKESNRKLSQKMSEKEKKEIIRRSRRVCVCVEQ